MLRFKQWLIRNEGFVEPTQQRPDKLLAYDAEAGRPQALPVVRIKGKMKKRMKKR